MFTLEQITTAHARVKTGSDFPAYTRELRLLGVMHYETFVSDGHTEFSGIHDYQVISPPKYDTQTVQTAYQAALFRDALQIHQQGGTDYFTFCRQCADSGIAKWTVCLEQMTCSYYDLAGNEALVEQIPG